MVHLIGLSHSFQVRAVKPFRDGGLDIAGSGHIAAQFEHYLDEVVQQLEPRAICEEYSNAKLVSQLEIDEQAYLVAKKVCGAHGLEHVFCDPDNSERAVLYSAHGTTEAEDERKGWPIREGEWLRRVLPHAEKGDVLFVCGADHVATFTPRLASVGIAASIVCEDFEQTIKAGVQ